MQPTTRNPILTSDKPFFAETQRLFKYVTDHNFADLADLCDDDFGIVDLGTEGESIMVRTRADWENWFTTLFTKLGAMDAKTDTDIYAYDAVQTPAMGYCVVEFCQNLYVGDQHGFFDCVVTIIWKRVGNQWKESRWHVSLLQKRWQTVG